LIVIPAQAGIQSPRDRLSR